MRPNPEQFGHLALEIMYGLRLATRLRAPLWLIRPDQPVNTALYALTAEGATIKVFDGWAGRALKRAFFPDHVSPQMLARVPKGGLVYANPFYFLVFLRVEAFLLRPNGPVELLSGSIQSLRDWIQTLCRWVDELRYRSKKLARKAYRRLGKGAYRIGKRSKRGLTKLQQGIRKIRRRSEKSWVRLLTRGQLRTYRFKKRAHTSLSAAAARLNAAAHGRGSVAAICLRSLGRMCRRLDALIWSPTDPPDDAVPAGDGRIASEVKSGHADTAHPAAVRHTDAEMAPASDSVTVAPAAPPAPTVPSPEGQSMILAQEEGPDTGSSVDGGFGKPGEIPPPLDLYRVASGLSPARAITAYMKRKVGNGPTYYKRLWLAQAPQSRIPVDLLPALEAEAEQRLGIHPKARIIGLHVRESGFKAGREVHEKKPHLLRNDALRNVTITNYRPALDFLVREGFTIVRMGDPTMTPLEHPGVVDLALSPARTDLLEAYCIERSDCFIGCESGPVVLACMFRKPHLVLNATDPLAVIPIGARGIFTFQGVRETATGRMLSPLDMLFPDYLHNLRNSRVYEYSENRPEDVLAAVKDLLAIVECGVAPETPEQQEFRLWALGVGVRMRLSHGGVSKWGPHRGYLGAGRIAASFGRKYIGPQLVAAEARMLPRRGVGVSLGHIISLHAGPA